MDLVPESVQEWITQFGNLAVVGPAAFAAWLWLARRRGISAALRFQWPVLAVFSVTVGLKLVSRTVGGSFAGTPFVLSTGAPSGHMSMAAVVYGGMALILLRRGIEPIGLLSALFVTVVLAGIAVTRVTLHAHTAADVAAGLVIGAMGAVWAANGADVPAAETVRQAAELAALVIAAVVLMHLSGLRFDSAAVI